MQGLSRRLAALCRFFVSHKHDDDERNDDRDGEHAEEGDVAASERLLGRAGHGVHQAHDSDGSVQRVNRRKGEWKRAIRQYLCKGVLMGKLCFGFGVGFDSSAFVPAPSILRERRRPFALRSFFAVQ